MMAVRMICYGNDNMAVIMTGDSSSNDYRWQ